MDRDPYYSFRGEGFSVDILIDAEDSLEGAELGDATVTIADGSKYSALFLTLAEIGRIMARHESSGESLQGGYFRTPDLVVIRRPGVRCMVDLIQDIVRSHEVASLLP